VVVYLLLAGIVGIPVLGIALWNANQAASRTVEPTGETGLATVSPMVDP